MLKNMRISVVVCTYNGGKYIREQLQSIIDQTMTVDEIIVCDDGSVDGTLNIVECVSDKASDISWKIEKNPSSLGVTKNFEKACKLASGEYVFFSDQDDIWEKNKVEEIMKIFEHTDANLVFGNASLFDDSGVFKDDLFSRFGFEKKSFEKDPFGLVLRKWFVTGATMACKKSFIEECMPFPVFWLHDQWLSFVACALSKIAVISDKLTRYRQHSSQVIGAKKATFMEKVAICVDYDAQADELKKVLGFRYFDEEIKARICDKVYYCEKRSKLLKKNRRSRIIYGFGMFKYYKKYTGKVILSYAKDIIK